MALDSETQNKNGGAPDTGSRSQPPPAAAGLGRPVGHCPSSDQPCQPTGPALNVGGDGATGANGANDRAPESHGAKKSLPSFLQPSAAFMTSFFGRGLKILAERSGQQTSSIQNDSKSNKQNKRQTLSDENEPKAKRKAKVAKKKVPFEKKDGKTAKKNGNQRPFKAKSGPSSSAAAAPAPSSASATAQVSGGQTEPKVKVDAELEAQLQAEFESVLLDNLHPSIAATERAQPKADLEEDVDVKFEIVFEVDRKTETTATNHDQLKAELQAEFEAALQDHAEAITTATEQSQTETNHESDSETEISFDTDFEDDREAETKATDEAKRGVKLEAEFEAALNAYIPTTAAVTGQAPNKNIHNLLPKPSIMSNQQGLKSLVPSAKQQLQRSSLAPPSPSPSVGSTASAAPGGGPTSVGTPRKDRDGAPIVYSQPDRTGTGENIISQMAYAISWLRSKEEPQTYWDVLSYLSATSRPESEQEYFVDQMRRNPQIQWIPDPDLSEQTWKSGTYVHRPIIPGVKSKDTLIAYLQKKQDASGVSVKDLKDGWPDCEQAIAELEREHKVLVVRAKKDGAARMVWLDDPSLFHEVDPELKLMWARVEVPSVDTIVQRLLAAQQKPASEDPRLKQAANAPTQQDKKKKRAQRRTGKATNTHMEHLLKDYSHLKR
ncbi:putative transcription initiation factor [Thermochaetoides thermophila DSM 1495]|uniref:Putative transcription initiation factor n=1 Tax=Chaetomium thermophilum (strain DSM 1495 / CBS 144.50 / IMI 039719) TaxID=759272 RepID=G0SA94_CHATD|nr:putative transcription initiation factor [Thermochaetoides thermophila DSM 1495]EGS19666.1 putative transcription initiation factor [Thermochaetoides thermophila DSM 1495]